jgi:hypothetical protein
MIGDGGTGNTRLTVNEEYVGSNPTPRANPDLAYTVKQRSEKPWNLVRAQESGPIFT